MAVDKQVVFAAIGKALISAQRVEFISKSILEVLSEFDENIYVLTSEEFLSTSKKAKKAAQTLGSVFKLLKLNPKLVIEDDLEKYRVMRNTFVHDFWRKYLDSISEEQAKRAIDFCYEFGRFSQRMESFFRGMVYFMALRHVKDRDHLDVGFKKWSKDFEYFLESIKIRNSLARQE